MKTLKTYSIFLFITCSLAMTLVSSCKSEDCKGHESFIKNDFESKAQNLGAQIDYLTVEYIGNCKYRVKEGYTLPTNSIMSGGYQTVDHIYTWKDGNYHF